MLKKIIFYSLVILCLSGCGKKNRFMKFCMKSDDSSVICECMYNGISKHITDIDNFIDWITTIQKHKELTLYNLKIKSELYLSNPEQWEQYQSLLDNYVLLCGMIGTKDADEFLKDIGEHNKIVEEAVNKKTNTSPSSNTPKISSKLALDISKPVYERNENISLLAQWTGADVDCKVLKEKVKETLNTRHFEIIDNSLSCSGNDNKSLIQLRVQFKSPRIGRLNIPSIKLDNNISSNSVDFSVRDSDALQNAIISKNIESIKAFLLSPLDLDKIKINDESPVVHFIKDDTDFAKELIKLGASPDVVDKDGYTPLMYAVIRQNNELLDLLLDKKVNLDTFDKKGRTAIMYAAIKNNAYAVKKLVEHRANLYKSKDVDWNAYKYAKELGHKEVEKLLNNFDYDELIIFTDKCDTCQQRKKIFEKIAENYKSLKIKYLPSSTAKQYLPSGNYSNPVILIRNSKNNIGQYITGWRGTEKQLEQIMFKD